MPALAIAITACSCSLLDLDDLALQSCEQAMDCYVLDRGGYEPDTCYRCNDGRCEAHGSLETRRFDAIVPTVQRVNTVTGLEHTTLMAATSDHEVHGFRLEADTDLSALGDVIYAAPGESSASCPVLVDDQGVDATCALRDHVTGWLSPAWLLAVSINVQGCDAGQVRVGLASVDTPFRLDPSSVHGALYGGVGVTPEHCTGETGARSPAVAALMPHDSEAEGYAIWLAAGASTDAIPSLDRCADSNLGLVAVEGIHLRVHDTDAAAWLASDSAESDQPVPLGRALASVAPRLVSINAAGFPGYLLAFVEAGGIRLQPLAAFDSGTAWPAVLEPDPDVNQIALSLGVATPSTQDVLLAWSTRCGDAREVWVAAYRWDASGLTSIAKPSQLEAGTNGIEGLTAAYSSFGFSRAPPSGGWSVIWQEHGSEPSLRANRISAFDDSATTTRTLRRGEARTPFIHVAKSAPFGYGFVTSDPNAQDDALQLMSCE